VAYIFHSFFVISLAVFSFSSFAEYETHRMNEIELPNMAQERNDISTRSGTNATTDYKPYNSSSDYKELSETHEIKRKQKNHMFNPAAAMKEASSNTKGKPDHDFYDESAEYKLLAREYEEKGMAIIAQDYERLSTIKFQAAKLADEGKRDNISWDEFNKIQERINSNLRSNKK